MLEDFLQLSISPIILAEGFLQPLIRPNNFLGRRGRTEDLKSEQRRQAVRSLGGNPRALQILVSALAFEPYGVLMPAESLAEREGLGPELAERLEKNFLEYLLAGLDEPERRHLQRLSVFRRPVKRKGIDALKDPGTSSTVLRNRLVNLFLLEHRRQRFELHPLAREIAYRHLSLEPDRFVQAHGRAADFFMRPFRAGQIVGAEPQLLGYFTEARYHLTQAQNSEGLAELAGRFSAHLQASYGTTSPVPKEARERDERIALLSGLLESPGAKGLEYYLARLYEARGHEGDAELALKHVRRATGDQAPAATWVLRIRLEAHCVDVEAAVKVARQGIEAVPPDQSLFSLYQSCGELLAGAGQVDEAVSLLREGIGRIEPNQNLFSLYQSCGELLAGAGQVDEAVSLLREVPGAGNSRSLLLALCRRDRKGEKRP